MTSTFKLSEETYLEWQDLAMDLMRAGGSNRDLIPVLGLSEEQWDASMAEVRSRVRARRPTMDSPIQIPPHKPDLLHLLHSRPQPETA